MVAMAVAPGRRNGSREMIDQRSWCERQRRGAVTLGLGQPVDDRFGIDQLQTLEREGWACTVAQQPRQAGAILCAQGHRGIWRETAVLPGEHLADVITLDQPAAGKPLQHSDAHLFGDGGDGLRCEFGGGQSGPHPSGGFDRW